MTEQVNLKKMHNTVCEMMVHGMNTYFYVDALQQGASQFEQQAGALKRKAWMKNMKVIRNYKINTYNKRTVGIY